MGACCDAASKDDEPLIPDVEKIIADYAWERFCDAAGRWRSMSMRRKNYTIEVPMNYFHFEEISDPKVDPLNKLPSVGHAATRSKTKLVHPEHTHLQNMFVNKTEDEQVYEFRFEKTRKASVSVNYQKGFSIGGKASFALDFAHVPGLEIDARYEVRKESGEVFEESVTTSVTSKVPVKPRSARAAVVVMEERRIHAKFHVTVKMTMPAGKAVVYIKNKYGERVSTRQINTLAPIFKGKYNTIENNGKAAIFDIHGIVEGSVLSNHEICLKDSDLLEEAVDTQVQPSVSFEEPENRVRRTSDEF